MPVQALIRKLSRSQVDAAIGDSKISVQDQDGQLLLVVDASKNGEGRDLAANAVLQKICDADSAIIQKEREATDAAEAAAKAKEREAADAEAAAARAAKAKEREAADTEATKAKAKAARAAKAAAKG